MTMIVTLRIAMRIWIARFQSVTCCSRYARSPPNAGDQVTSLWLAG